MGNAILEKIKKTDNLEELLTTENDSELLFQLSHMRKNIIEWIPAETNGAVLEIGAGCGIVTSLLADRYASVIAVENNGDYLEVNQFLNRDKNNVKYLAALSDCEEKAYDTVILLGLSEQCRRFDMTSCELLDLAIRCLKQGGQLILAMDNKYALKFWAGMKNSNASESFDTISGLSQELTFAQVKEQLVDSGLSSVKCYYPTADYRLPVEIFSEKYPIKEGSIVANTRDYENTRYQIFDEPIVADELCKDGLFAQFANSYLLIAKADVDEKLDQILYIKYNSMRDARFQLRTSILEENDVRFVQKAPMVSDAKKHLSQMLENRSLLEKVYQKVRLVECEKNGEALCFSFIKGQPIFCLSDAKNISLEALVNQIQEAFSLMFDVKQEICVPFAMTDEFQKMFPDCTPGNGVPAYAIANLDSIVSNFVKMESGDVYCLDYEWVSNFPIPVNYVKYRSLLYIFNENQKTVSALISRDELLRIFNFSDDEIALYNKMESQFQQHVHGKGLKYNYLQRYEKPSISWKDLIAGGATERIEEFTRQLQDKEQHIQNLEYAGKAKDLLIEERNAMIAHRDAELKCASNHLQSARAQMQAQKDYIDCVAYLKRKPMRALADKVKNRLEKRQVLKHIGSESIAKERREQYQKQMERRDLVYENMMRSIEQKEDYDQEFSYCPLISVLVPVYNVADEYLVACIESVRNQIYPNWELCMADDCSTQGSVRTILKRYENDKRIKICYRTENGHISKCTNSALEMASGEFVGFLDCDDTLSKNALFEVVKVLNENNQLDFIYSDEDKIFADGEGRHNPHFKPDWSPDTLMSFMYTSHFSVYRTSITKKIGGLRSECDGAQDYDFTLRFTEQIPAKHIFHIQKVLYHWREIDGSTSGSLEAKPYVIEAQRRAKKDALNRRGLQGVLTQEMNQIHVTYVPQGNPKVSIIIPSKDNYEILKRAVDSLVSITAYENYEVILVDNGSADECRKKYNALMQEYQTANPQMKFIYHYEKMQFNFSHMCNLGVSLASGDIYLFLNDDIEVLHPNWLSVMAGQAQVPHSGAVGAKLYYPDSKKIQHAGIIQIKNGPSHAFCGFEDKELFYFGRNCLNFNYCAVTGACLAVSADKFREVGGFEENLPVAYNDVDLCFKLYEAGYYNVMRTDAVLYHHESVSRGYDYLDKQKMERLERERTKLYERHPKLAEKDPFYHPYLVQNNVDFSYNSADICNSEIPIPKAKVDFDSHLNVDQLSVEDEFVFAGWSWDETFTNNNEVTRYVLLERVEGNQIVESRCFDTFTVYRPDVADGYPNRYDLDYIGFFCRIKRKILNSGTYYVSLISSPKYGGKAKKHRVAWSINV